MELNEPVRKIAVAFITRTNRLGNTELLAYSNLKGLLLRLPGGNVDPDEAVEEALFREILEETGLTNLTLIRKLGVQHYYKKFIDSEVERHDFLLTTTEELPDKWEFIGSGSGNDHGTLFKYQWVHAAQIHFIDEEFRRNITEAYIRELFSGSI